MSAPVPVRAVIGAQLTVTNAPADLIRGLNQAHTLPNPDHQAALRYGRYAGQFPEADTYYTQTPDGWVSPRGSLHLLKTLCARLGLPLEIDDRTVTCPVSFPSLDRITLSPAQADAVAAVVDRDGLLVAPTGSGKTTMGLAYIARRGERTIIIVHTAELAAQWRARLVDQLGVLADEIGMVGGGKCAIGKRITICMVQTLARRIPPELLTAGLVIVDECHHVPAEMTAGVIAQFPARHLVGLSATPYRRDGRDAVIRFYLGEIAHTLEHEDVAERVIRPTVYKRDTGITPRGNDFVTLVSRLIHHPERNALIVDDVTRAVRAGYRPLVLTDRVEHAERLGEMLTGLSAVVIHGDRPKQERASLAERVASGDVRIVVATGALVGEGWDCPPLDVLMLATPVSYRGRITQYTGRIARSAPGKQRAIVWDYCDDHPMLWAAWKKRRAAYEDLRCPVRVHAPAAA